MSTEKYSIASPDLPSILNYERRVWDALLRGDGEADNELLDERFLGVYPSGFANRAAHVEQLIGGPSITEFSLHETHLLVVRPDVVMLSYLAVFRRAGVPADAQSEHMYVSSLWHFESSGWRNIFSQDTIAIQ
jgi:hypothetical protein